MKKLLVTNAANITALIARLALGITLFPHGAQKLFGWFGGYGFGGTIGFLTAKAGLPYILALLVILIESIGALFVLVGFITRIAAFGIFVEFIGVIFKVHLANGFFMNWSGSQKGEGIEYFILLLGLALILIITGGGKASVDAAITSTSNMKNSISVE
ncbi:DoxX family protein [Segetibacter koreensis]|uniref:DoxX family protein n=1 Tax=Segetibacter koreensis TaxID=398037 RepID=UPI0003732768|nr:DoxX family protein [Segetibacter koreensis]